MNAKPIKLPSVSAVASSLQWSKRNIGDDYLARLSDAYTRYFHQYDAAPLLIVNSDNLNFVDSPVDFDLLLQRIVGMRGPREFFSSGR